MTPDIFIALANYGPPYAIVAVLLFMFYNLYRANEKSVRESIGLLTKVVEQVGEAVKMNGENIKDIHADCEQNHLLIRDALKDIRHIAEKP
jgi:hypothetical protein